MIFKFIFELELYDIIKTAKKASESERWCLFEVTVGHDVQCECKITHDGFTIRSNYEQGKEQIGLAISVGREGVDMQGWDFLAHLELRKFQKLEFRIQKNFRKFL